jgi:uncharacterized protein YqgC (DUF456 family)
MDWLFTALGILFALFGLACLLLVAVGLPGTWLLLGVAVLVELVDGPVLGRGGPGAVSSFGWGVVLAGSALAALGEGLEFVSGAAGAKLGGSTRRGIWGALLGGLAGAIVFTPIIPVPLVGTLLGALVGTFLGAWIGEATGPVARGHRDTLRAALAAVFGRLAGLLAKLAVGATAWVLLVRAALGI